MEKKNRKHGYIKKAISVFKHDGLRLSLEETAGKIGVTKKTLYNHFSSKDELLMECIQFISSEFQRELSELDNPNLSAIENLRNGFLGVNRFFTMLSPVFFHDLMRLNPNQAMSEHMIGSAFFLSKIQTNLKQGIGEGVYREDLNIELISQYMSYSIFGFYINGVINHNSLITTSYFQDIIEYNLRAIVSEQGKHLL